MAGRTNSLARIGAGLAIAVLAACARQVPVEVPAREFVVFFPADKADLPADGQKIVAEIAAAAQSLKARHLTVEGEADNVKSAHGVALAEQRGAVVAAALSQDGVPASDIQVLRSVAVPADNGVAGRKVVVRLTPG